MHHESLLRLLRDEDTALRRQGRALLRALPEEIGPALRGLFGEDPDEALRRAYRLLAICAGAPLPQEPDRWGTPPKEAARGAPLNRAAYGFAADCASRTLPLWRAGCPGDDRLAEALDLLHAFAESEPDPAHVSRARRLADAARGDLAKRIRAGETRWEGHLDPAQLAADAVFYAACDWGKRAPEAAAGNAPISAANAFHCAEGSWAEERRWQAGALRTRCAALLREVSEDG